MPRVSVVVPTLDEEEHIEACLGGLLAEEGVAEVLVVDGGSRDETVARARAFAGVEVLRCDRAGRAEQLNRGARRTRGELLWFVHADCRVEPGSVDALLRAAGRAGFVGGAFRFAIDSERRVYRLLEQGVRLRSEWLGLPYGDQGLFLPRAVFEQVGGYPEVAVLEDLYLVRSLRRRGPVQVLPVPLGTSARRWERRGLFWTTAWNLATLLLDWLGLDPVRLGPR